jgi:hypothetical protein
MIKKSTCENNTIVYHLIKYIGKNYHFGSVWQTQKTDL